MATSVAEQPHGALDLPAGFSFGVCTAAYQIEGAVNEGARSRSVWDDFCDERPDRRRLVRRRGL